MVITHFDKVPKPVESVTPWAFVGFGARLYGRQKKQKTKKRLGRGERVAPNHNFQPNETGKNLVGRFCLEKKKNKFLDFHAPI
mgnify:CR=1 FL=1